MKGSTNYYRFLLGLCCFSFFLTSCSFFSGGKDKDFRETIPVGTFVGIGIPLEPGSEVLAKIDDPEEEPVVPAPVATSESVAPAVPSSAEKPAAATSNNEKEPAANNATAPDALAPTNAPATEIPAAIPEKLKPKKKSYKGPKLDLLINLFPMDTAYRQGVGIMRINNRSYKFNWESDSVNKNVEGNSVWNISFSKDNNIYANLDENFNFTGILEQKDTGLELYGTLSIKPTKAEDMLNYHVQTYQQKAPIISASGEVSVKAGENLVIEAEQSGTDKTSLTAYAESLDGKTKTELTVFSVDKPEKGKKKNKITIVTDAAMVKGDYNLYVMRSEEFVSNNLKVTIQ